MKLSLYGGVVFTLVYGSRDATKDVDAVVRPGEIARKLALKVAKELGLPDDWLNDHVKPFLAEKEAKRQLNEVDFGKGLHVSVPTAVYLLAMKLRACRPPLDEGSTPVLRNLALARAPFAFKRRNIFTPLVDLPLALRAGRPVNPPEKNERPTRNVRSGFVKHAARNWPDCGRLCANSGEFGAEVTRPK